MGCCISDLKQFSNNKTVVSKKIFRETEVLQQSPKSSDSKNDSFCNDPPVSLRSNFEQNIPNDINFRLVNSLNTTNINSQNSVKPKLSNLPPLPKVSRNLLIKFQISNDSPFSKPVLNQASLETEGKLSSKRPENITKAPLNRKTNNSQSSNDLPSIGSNQHTGLTSSKSANPFSSHSSQSDLVEAKSLRNCGSKCRKSSVLKVDKIEKKKISKEKTQINQYLMSNLIGSGAFGKVYLATDDKRETVAIKVYNKRILKTKWIGKSRTALSFLYSEVQIMENLSHQNIVQLFEVIDRADYHKTYLVLEYVNGQNLYDRLPCSEGDARNYLKQLASALDYLHNTARVVHYDLKPQNIILSKEGVVKICDFGSAQFIDRAPGGFQSSAGTYAFMAPELHGKSKKNIGPAADIWALGITLYYILEGKTPFKSRKSLDLCEEVQKADIQLPSYFSEELLSLLFRMLDKDPETRVTINEIKESGWVKGG